MSNLEVKTFCGKCQGTGTTDSQHGGSQACGLCGGLGRFEMATVDISDLESQIDDVKDKVDDILELLQNP